MDGIRRQSRGRDKDGEAEGEGKSVFQTEQYVKEQICNKCLLKN